eukprot:TRINITY_DN6986_c0_g1_i2.p1 TRINITY_DN6986_c0_g1~~TRINITY_DN6986_c0_g1_i2.p1  ORF type:complete len:371 (+),score=66.57 TRINITY_DN6986_c0_g1_i2:321-1433(+)
MVSDGAYGFTAALISILFFGSNSLPLKSKRVVEAKTDPMVFQLYYSLAIFITSWLALLYEHVRHGSSFEFTYIGIVASSLWVPASVLSFFAIQYIGLSIAQGTWSGVTILISFLWGAFKFQNHVNNVFLAIFSLVLLMIGVAGLSLCKNRFYIFEPYPSSSSSSSSSSPQQIQEERSPMIRGQYTGVYNDDDDMSRSSFYPSAHPSSSQEASVASIRLLFKNTKLLGTVCAVGLGLLNGTLMVPMQYLPKGMSMMMYTVNFGIGVIIVTPVVAIIYFALKRECPEFNPKVVALPAFIGGILWNIGNVGSIVATQYLGLTIGYPLSQLALLVGGLWGMFLFKEITGMPSRVQFFIAAAVLLLGALLLSLFG